MSQRFGDHHEGLFPRVFGGVAQGLGLKRKHVIIGFIVLCVFNFPLALILFGLGWLYVDKPHSWSKFQGKAERGCKYAFRKAREDGERYARAAKEQAETAFTEAKTKTAQASHTASEKIDPEAGDPFFADLRARFADLEQRAGKMETYVTSQEFRLNREFRNLQG